MIAKAAEKKHTILIIDDEIEICNILGDFISFMGHNSLIETSGETAYRNLKSYTYDLLIVDLNLGVISGTDILKKSKKIHPFSEVIIITGYGTEEAVQLSMKYGASSFIQKPITFAEVRVRINESLAKYDFSVKNHHLLTEIGRTNSSLKQHMKKILLMYNMGIYLSTTIDFENVIDSVLKGISQFIPAEYYHFFLTKDPGSNIYLYSEKPISSPIMNRVRKETLSFWQDLMKKTPERRDVKVIPTLSAKHARKIPRKVDGTFYSTFVPIIIKNHIRGLLGISATQKKGLREDTENTLHLIAHQVANIVANAALLEDTKMLALTDGLTGLLNHRAFHDRLKNEFDRFLRYGTFLSLILLDLDNLKEINDSYGHPQGDVVLRGIGNILKETSRESDILARYGGDEFVVILPQTNAKNALTLAERIRSKVARTEFKVGKKKINASLTIGVATVPDVGIKYPHDLVEYADKALYMAKRAGKNRVIMAK